ncbi:MAG: tyrosine--tRNA ligase [Cryobacterium sp.]|nr:tyrosine--tRNA ligase [Oligoflexia bacterium]
MNGSSLFSDLEFRGLIKQSTSPDLQEFAEKQKLTLYAGFDPTANSLHVGSLLPILTLKRFQNAGHRVIALVGGATGMIGDPTGKSQERTFLSGRILEENVSGIRRVIEHFLKTDGENQATLVNNYDWFQGIGYLQFLREVGKHFTVNHMMAKESVRARLEDRDHGISYTEFSYMLLQAYDYVVLNEREGCNLQIGGSDQWGNITAGVELIRRIRAHRENRAEDKSDSEEKESVFGLTQPLVMKADGTKFGKSESGTVWLTADRTSPYQLYQFFVGTSDADVGTLLRYFTFLTHDEIRRLDDCVKNEPGKREAQLVLAREMVKLIHGDHALENALQATKALFGAEISSLSRDVLLDAFAGAPTTLKPRATLTAGISITDLLTESGLCASKGAARKDIQGGGIYLNNVRVEDPATLVFEKDLLAAVCVVVRKGKKSYHLFRFDENSHG